MICKYCGNKMDDLTHGKGEHRNYICFAQLYDPKRICKAHYWKNKWYTSKEWDEWINETEIF